MMHIVHELGISGGAARQFLESLRRDQSPTVFVFKCHHCLTPNLSTWTACDRIHSQSMNANFDTSSQGRIKPASERGVKIGCDSISNAAQTSSSRSGGDHRGLLRGGGDW